MADQICRMNIQRLGVYMASPIGAVRVKNNILSPFCLFDEIMPISKAVAGGNGNRFLTQKLHVQISYNLRSPQCQTIAE